jgi:hypothetical protein
MFNDIRGHAVAALTLSASLCVLASVHATHGTFDDQLTTTADYLNDGSFTLALVAFALAVQGFARLAPPRWALRLATIGPLLVAAGVAPALATGESPGWFAAVGVPGNLMWLVGTIALGVWAWRSRAIPRPLAAGVAATVPFALILAEIGGSAIPAIVWAAIGLRWLAGTRPSSEARGFPTGANRTLQTARSGD